VSSKFIFSIVFMEHLTEVYENVLRGIESESFDQPEQIMSERIKETLNGPKLDAIFRIKNDELRMIVENDDVEKFNEFCSGQVKPFKNLRSVTGSTIYHGSVKCFRYLTGRFGFGGIDLMFCSFEAFLIHSKNNEIFNILWENKKIDLNRFRTCQIKYHSDVTISETMINYLDRDIQNSIIYCNIRSLVKLLKFRSFIFSSLVQPSEDSSIHSSEDLNKGFQDLSEDSSIQSQVQSSVQSSEDLNETFQNHFDQSFEHHPEESQKGWNEIFQKILEHSSEERSTEKWKNQLKIFREQVIDRESKKEIKIETYISLESFPVIDALVSSGYEIFIDPKYSVFQAVFGQMFRYLEFETFEKLIRRNNSDGFPSMVSCLSGISYSILSQKDLPMKPKDMNQKFQFLVDFYGPERIIQEYPFECFHKLVENLSNNYAFGFLLRLVKMYKNNLKVKDLIRNQHKLIRNDLRNEHILKRFKIYVLTLIKNGYSLSELDRYVFNLIF